MCVIIANTPKGILKAMEAKLANLPIDPADASVLAGLIADLDTLIDGIVGKIGTPLNTAGTATIAAMIGDPYGDSIIIRLAWIQAQLVAIKAKTDTIV